ncbi:MAG: tRNA (guanosine(46)-N7)-methyltransferase TrmB, partial [Candidatus Methylopumilus sp.]
MTEQNKEEIKKRPIRTYILRQGRITAAQKKAIQDNFQKHAVIFENKIINFDDIFKNKNSDLILEIGFGMGTSTAEIAKSNLNKNYIAIEVHSPGVGNLLKLIQEDDISNLKIIQHDAVEVLNLMI